MNRSPDHVLELLRSNGATRLRSVVFRRNRSTLWSLTQGGRVLNLHIAYSAAPSPVMRAIAVVCRDAFRPGDAYAKACETVRSWSGVHDEIRRIRASHTRAAAPNRRGPGVGPCCATPSQRIYLRRLYRYLNTTRFGGRLPLSVPVRLSNRFRSRLGQMVPGEIAGKRVVLEIALNVDLMLEGNGRQRLDTLLHEMAHAADYLFDGQVGHGPTWQRWAERAGCEVSPLCTAGVRYRRRRTDAVSRVPALPPGWRTLAA